MTDSAGFAQKKFLISKQPCFSKLMDEETDVLAELLTEKHIKAGDAIVVEGALIDSVYIIVHGSCEVRVNEVENGVAKYKVVATLDAEEAIGLNDVGFYSLSGRRTATVVALTDMVLLRLSVAAFHGFALAYSHVNTVMHHHAKTMLGLEDEEP
jgi:CRP-like cAMP-binding protein